MVDIKAIHLRPAIAMVELIFAIVIMGIVILPAPMLINTATESTYVGIQQEGINEAATKVNMLLSYPWDENDTDSNNTLNILRVTSGNPLFDPNSAKDNRTRIGIPVKSSRMFKDLNASIALGLDSSETDTSDADDVDDFNGESLATLVNEDNATSSDTDYIEKTTIKIDTIVSYGSDDYTDGSLYTYVPFNPATGSTNVKIIQVTLTSTNTSNADALAKTIVLRAFSCNIGGIKYAEKWF